MDRQFQRPAVEPRDESSVGRLPGDPIPADDVERVLRRAIELQTDDTRPGPGFLTEERLIEVARELRIDPDNLRRALAEHRAGVIDDPSQAWASLLGPERIGDSRMISGGEAEAHTAAAAWLRNEEGLTPRRHLADGIDWEPDGRLWPALRMKLRLTRGTGTLRMAELVTHRVEPVGPNRQLVSIEVDSRSVRRNAKAILVAGAASTLAVLVATLAAGVGVLTVAIPVATVTAAGFLGLAFAVSRSAIRRLRRGVDRALDAISDSVRSPRR